MIYGKEKLRHKTDVHNKIWKKQHKYTTIMVLQKELNSEPTPTRG